MASCVAQQFVVQLIPHESYPNGRSLGLFLGFITYRSQTLYPAMFCHMVNNGLFVILSNITPGGTVQLEKTGYPPLFLGMAVALLALCVFGLGRLTLSST